MKISRSSSASTILLLALTASGFVACSTAEEETTEDELGGIEFVSCQDEFHKAPLYPDNGKYAVLPKNALLPNGLDAAALDRMKTENPAKYESIMRGRCTWIQDTAGTERLYRALTIKTEGVFDILLTMDTNPRKYESSKKANKFKTMSRDQRWGAIGVMNEPGCREGDVDQYGLKLDVCPHDPMSAGVVGIRKMRNPNFNAQVWKDKGGLAGYIEDRTIEPPYLIGATCGSCHVSHNPNNPPADPKNPKWENLDAHIGNQYIHEGAFFGINIPEDDLRSQVMLSQQRGTSDTSRIATDHINNPNTINAIFNLGGRATFSEVQNDGSTATVHHVLKDGADSVGIELAMMRVHTNIGMCSEQWLPRHDALLGKKPQAPLSIAEMQANCPEFPGMRKKMADQAAFLSQSKPFKLPAQYLGDPAKIASGAKAFAKACATCHSSIQPEGKGAFDQTTGGWTMTDEQIGQFFLSKVVDASGKPDPKFLENNYLADDVRYPVGYLGTNIARAVATNALGPDDTNPEGHIWAEYSSSTYKNQQHFPQKITIKNPYAGQAGAASSAKDVEHTFRPGTGFYRTPPLTSIWTSAPFLHNNSLGKYNGDPSFNGRLDAFKDAVTQLLFPATRQNVVKLTDRDSKLELTDAAYNIFLPSLHIKKGTPINSFAHTDPRSKVTQAKMGAITVASELDRLDVGDDRTWKMFELGGAPDLVENRGHVFGSEQDPSTYRRLSDVERQDLIEYLKTL